MVRRLPVALVLVVLEQGEVDDPAEGEAVLDQTEVRTEPVPDGTQAVAALLPVLVGDDEDHVPVMRTRGLDDLPCLVGEELRHASGKGSVLHLHPCKTMGTVDLGTMGTVDLGGILQARDVLPGELLPVACGGDEVLDRSAGGERLGEGVERTALGEGEVLHLQTEAQVGLVAAVCVHRVMVGEPPRRAPS